MIRPFCLAVLIVFTVLLVIADVQRIEEDIVSGQFQRAVSAQKGAR